MTDLIKQVGGIGIAKEILRVMIEDGVKTNCYLSQEGLKDYTIDCLDKAIADHNRTDNCYDIKSHLSPSTEVIER